MTEMGRPATPALSLEELQDQIDREVGVSDWMVVDQERIDHFAEVTEDWQYIHVDPVRAAGSPFGGTIAHGFLTLSLLSKLANEALPAIGGAVMGINYGFDRVRMVAPVRAGARVRARFTLKRVQMKSPARLLLTHEVTVEVEGMARPALIADWLILQELAREQGPAMPPFRGGSEGKGAAS